MYRVLRILGIVFTVMGLLFTALGGTLALLVEPMLFLFALPGLIFLVLGLSFFGANAHTRKIRQWLAENGRRIEADIIGIQYDTRVRVNGRCPLVIQCQAVNPADGKVYVFESEGLWFDPEPFLGERTTLPVLVDPDNYHRYRVVTEGVVPEKG